MYFYNGGEYMKLYCTSCLIDIRRFVNIIYIIYNLNIYMYIQFFSFKHSYSYILSVFTDLNIGKSFVGESSFNLH